MLIWWEYALIAATFAAILTVFAVGMFGFLRTRVQKWIGGSTGLIIRKLMEEAEKEGGGEGGTPGLLKLGGFEIDVGTIKELLPLIPQILQLAKTFGLTSGGGGGGGGKIGL